MRTKKLNKGQTNLRIDFFICEGVVINSIDCGTKVKNMIKEVIHAPILLAMKSEKATIEDLQVADAFVCELSTNDATKNGGFPSFRKSCMKLLKSKIY